ncbi:MAG: LamG domain-containing protein [Candidatus Poribacteria bacterium]|nr:LamG domain-containing protein [Candidatus Poribacteria bacterium]
MEKLFDYTVLFSALMLIAADYAAADIADGLVVHFTFDSVKGKRILDESGNGLDAEVIKNTQFVKGKYGKAIRITGETEDCVNIPSSDALEISDEITMMAWVYHEDWTRRSFQWFDKGCYSKPNESYGMVAWGKKDFPELEAFERGSVISMLVGGADLQQSITTLNEMKHRTWHHVVGIYGDKTLNIYLDGEMIANLPSAADDFSSTNEEDLRIGCAKNKPQYAFEGGSIDEVAIWSRALSEDEVRTVMRGPLLAVSPKGKVTTTWGDIKRKGF